MRKSQFVLKDFNRSIRDFASFVVEEIMRKKSKNNIDWLKSLFATYNVNFGKYNKDIILKELYEYCLILVSKRIRINTDWLLSSKTQKYFTDSVFKKVVENYKNQITFTIRTSNSTKLGQFSTPLPISLLMYVWTIANQPAYPLTIDPFAGTGNLLTFFPEISTYANDIDKLRATILYQTYKEYTYSFDGSNLDNWKEFNSLRKFDIVVTNPPFYPIDKTKNEAINFYGYDIKKFDYKLALISLELMKDSGRAAIIISGSPANIYPVTFWNKYGQYTNGQERSFWFALYQNYNVADVIYLNGYKLYKKQGQATNLRLILIDGRKSKSNKSIVPPIFNAQYDKLTNSFTDLYDRIMKTRQNLLGLNMQTVSNNLGDLEGPYFPQSKAKRLNVDVPDNMDDEIHKVTKNLAQKVGDIDEYVRRKLQYTTKEELYKALSAEQIDAVALAIYNIEIKELGLIVADQTGIGKGRIAASIMRYARNIGKVPIFLTIKSSLFSDIYRDLNNIGSDDLIPIEEPERDEDGNIIVKYKKNINEETGEVYLTEKNPKYYKVEHDVCCKKRFVPFIINSNVNIKDSKGNIIYKSSESHKDIPKVEKFDFSGYDCVLATYSQFNFYDGFPYKKKKQVRISTIGKTNRKTWLSEIAKDNIVIMDESHEAGGQGNIGYFFKQLIPNTKSTIYLSATYAKYPTSIPIYFSKTALKYTGLSDESLVGSLIFGGNVFQELISSNLVESGSLIRRERPLKDIIFRFIVLDSFGAKQFRVPDKEIEHKFIFDTITKVLRGIIDFQKEYVKPYIKERNDEIRVEYRNVKDTQGLGVKNSPIFSRLFQIINQVVFSLKAESIGNLAVERLKNGYKPVITFQNTMESLQKDLIKESGNSGTIPSSINYILKKSLEKILVYKLTSLNYVYYSKIDVEKEMPEAKDDYYKILDNIENLNVDIEISPIDTIKNIISKAGYSIGEMTGRTIEMEKISKNTYKIRKRRKENITDIARKFQNNEIDCVLLNESGSTGISLHATTEGTDLKEKDLMPRAMIMAQPPLNINIFTQMLGRINRSGQLLQPEYDIVSLSVPAEKRLMAMLQGKMASLSANTTADQKSGKNVISVVNFMNKYGDAMAIQWLDENPKLDKIMDYPLYVKSRFCKNDDDDCYEKVLENAARRISGRVAVLPIENQDDFYKTVSENYIKLKADLESKGEWDLEISQLNLDAKIISETVIAEGVDNSEPFTSDIVLQECDVKVLRKPYSQKEIRNFVEKNLNGQTVEEQQVLLSKKYNKYIQNKINNEIKGINEQYDKKIKKAPNLPSLKKIKKEEGEKIFKERLKNEISILVTERNIKINQISDNYDLTKNRILGYFQKFKTGYGYDFDTKITYLDDDGQIIKVVVKAVFLGFKIASDNMVTSNISFKFALAHSKKVKEFKATDSFASELFDNVLKYNMSNNGQIDTLKKWTELCKNFTKDRETRYLIVGNVVKAFGSNEYQGELCNAVYSDGTIRKAVFMSEKFNSNVIQTSVFISEIVPILEDFGTFSTDEKTGIKTIQNGIVLTKQSSFIWKIELPSSARESARFYKNDKLINLTEEGEFQQIKQGTRWFANVHINNLPTMLKILANDFGVEIKLNPFQLKKIKKLKPKEQQTDVKLVEYNVQYEKYDNVAGLGNIDNEIAESKQMAKEFAKKRNIVTKINFDKIL